MNTLDHISLWTLALVVLKISGYITLGWMWVLAPMWITAITIFLMAISGYKSMSKLVKPKVKIPGKKA